MNILICLITIKSILTSWRFKNPITAKSGFLIYLGAVAPVGDYILRLVLGEIWFQTSGLIFHSVIYQGLVWSLFALLHWVYWRNIRQAVNCLLPLLGLLAYTVFTILSTEAMPFFAPLSHAKVSFNLVNAGYLIPMVLAIMLRTTIKWIRLNNLIVSRISLSILLIFIVSMGLAQLNIKRTSSNVFSTTSELTIIPTGILPYSWAVVSLQDFQYQVGRYNLFKGWDKEIDTKHAFLNFKMAQNALLDPRIFLIYVSAFKNPVISASIQNETMMVDISELTPYSELWWVDRLQIIINKTGQFVDYNIDYRTLQF